MGSWLERNRGPVLIGLTALVVAGAVALVRQQRSDPGSLEIHLDDAPGNGALLEVHVAGAVLQPGVYTLHDGDRVADALDAAGGPLPEADLTSLNLAERVHDEEQVVVPLKNAAPGEADDGLPVEKIDINTAPAALLDTLPGIGEVYSRRIVDSRESAGPYQTIDELVEREVIPQGTFEKITELITAGP